MFISYDISGDTLHLVSMATFKFVFPLADDICPYRLLPPPYFLSIKKGLFHILAFCLLFFYPDSGCKSGLGN